MHISLLGASRPLQPNSEINDKDYSILPTASLNDTQERPESPRDDKNRRVASGTGRVDQRPLRSAETHQRELEGARNLLALQPAQRLPFCSPSALTQSDGARRN